MTPLAYRPAAEADLGFVAASWVQSYRTAYAAGLIAMEDWAEVMHPQIRRVLARPGVATWVAYHPGEDDGRSDLYGWICVERDAMAPRRAQDDEDGRRGELAPVGPLVHYAYVKAAYRRAGIATGLMRAVGIDPAARLGYSCRTAVVSRLAHRIPRATWMPLVARYPKDRSEA